MTRMKQAAVNPVILYSDSSTDVSLSILTIASLRHVFNAWMKRETADSATQYSSQVTAFHSFVLPICLTASLKGILDHFL